MTDKQEKKTNGFWVMLACGFSGIILGAFLFGDNGVLAQSIEHFVTR